MWKGLGAAMGHRSLRCPKIDARTGQRTDEKLGPITFLIAYRKKEKSLFEIVDVVSHVQ